MLRVVLQRSPPVVRRGPSTSLRMTELKFVSPSDGGEAVARRGASGKLTVLFLKTAQNNELLQTLRSLRRRLLGQIFLVHLVRWALVAAGVILTAAALNRWLFLQPALSASSVAGAGLAALLVAVIGTWLRRPTTDQVAALIDTRGATRDRLVTALRFGGAETAWESAAVRECLAYVKRSDFRAHTPLGLPREWRFLAIPAVALGLLQWQERVSSADAQLARAAAQAEIAGTVNQLEQLSRETAKAAEQSQSEELKRMAEQLQRSARELQATAKEPGDAARDALRELSALEQMIKEMQAAAEQATPEEMQELAKSLEKQEATKEAAQAMQAGELAKAAEELEKAAAQEPKSAEEAAQALREAMQRLAEKQQRSQQLDQLAKQMQQSGSEGQKALQQLAEMLRKMQPQQQQSSPSQKPGDRQQSKQDLQSLLAALQNMKFGEGQPSTQPGAPADAKGAPPQVLVQSFDENGKPDSAIQIPSGKPGSERDEGSTESALGEERAAAPEKGNAQQLAGRLGEGETLQQFLPSAGDTSRSSRRYKEIYEAMAPAAEDALVQENIPLGSRFFIKRYFESIRPAE